MTFATNPKYIDAENMSASITGNPIDLTNVTGYSIQAAWTQDGTSAVAKNFLAGVAEVDTITFPDLATIAAGDYVVVYSQSGTTFAIAADKTGADPAPTGAAYIAASQKAQVDLSATTTAAQVAAAFEIAFNALTGFTALVTTDDTAADGTMTFTQTVRGVTTNPVPHNTDDTGAGAISVAETTAGVNSAVNTTTNVITISSHGFLDTQVVQLSTAGTLPAPLAASTDYFVIVVDSNSVKLATSDANAIAGTAVDITNQGSSGSSFTATPQALAGTVKLQASSNAYLPDARENSDASWADISGSSVAVSGSGSNLYNVSGAFYRWARLVWTRTGGNGTVSAQYHGKNK